MRQLIYGILVLEENKQCSIPRSKVISGKFPYGVKNWLLPKS